jgi:hypothetical protein
MEAVRILANAALEGQISQEDRAYLGTLTARNTGLTPDDANARVDNVLQQVERAKTKAKKMADDARKAAATMAFVTVLSMFIGAFIACAAAALGGHLRDENDGVVR